MVARKYHSGGEGSIGGEEVLPVVAFYRWWRGSTTVVRKYHLDGARNYSVVSEVSLDGGRKYSRWRKYHSMMAKYCLVRKYCSVLRSITR